MLLWIYSFQCKPISRKMFILSQTIKKIGKSKKPVQFFFTHKETNRYAHRTVVQSAILSQTRCLIQCKNQHFLILNQNNLRSNWKYFNLLTVILLFLESTLSYLLILRMIWIKSNIIELIDQPHFCGSVSR